MTQKLLGLLCLYLSIVNCLPSDSRNPNLEYELINARPEHAPNSNPRPTFVPITRKPLIINTPPPVDPDTKSFAFDPQSQTWTMVKKNDPEPVERTLLWNQSNDKWLTRTPHA